MRGKISPEQSGQGKKANLPSLHKQPTIRTMIAIVNVGPHDDPNPLGERNYELRINSDVIATFKHKRGDGLAKCLMLAAAAEERRKWEFAAKIVARQSLPNNQHNQ
jgi:hypothetical protein